MIRYVAAPRGLFKPALDLRGTPLQRRVWEEVRKIRFGESSSYTKIAAAIGAPRAIRAVASACARNWWAFAVPCHRVLHTGKAAAARRGPQYRWVDYERRLAAS